jgi:hypothetical protein
MTSALSSRGTSTAALRGSTPSDARRSASRWLVCPSYVVTTTAVRLELPDADVRAMRLLVIVIALAADRTDPVQSADGGARVVKCSKRAAGSPAS